MHFGFSIKPQENSSVAFFPEVLSKNRSAHLILHKKLMRRSTFLFAPSFVEKEKSSIKDRLWFRITFGSPWNGIHRRFFFLFRAKKKSVMASRG